MNLISVIYVIQDLENTGKKRIEFLIHKKKLADQKSNQQKVSVWTDSSAFLYNVFM